MFYVNSKEMHSKQLDWLKKIDISLLPQNTLTHDPNP